MNVDNELQCANEKIVAKRRKNGIALLPIHFIYVRLHC